MERKSDSIGISSDAVPNSQKLLPRGLHRVVKLVIAPVTMTISVVNCLRLVKIVLNEGIQNETS